MLEVTSVTLLAAGLGSRRGGGSGSRGRGRGRRGSRGSDGSSGGGGLSGGRGGGGGGRSGSSRGGGGGGGGSSGGGRGGGGAGGAVQGGSGDGVAVKGGVDVEEDTGVGLGVQGSTQSTVGQLSAVTSDLEVDTHGVVLSTIRVLGGVEGNDLVAENVVAGLQGRGDGDVPSEVVGDQVVRGPETGVGSIYQTTLVDLDPLKGGLVNGGRVISRSDVGDDGTFVLY